MGQEVECFFFQNTWMPVIKQPNSPCMLLHCLQHSKMIYRAYEDDDDDDDDDVDCTTDLLLRACFEATSVGDHILHGLFPLRHLHSQTLFVHSTEL